MPKNKKFSIHLTLFDSTGPICGEVDTHNVHLDQDKAIELFDKLKELINSFIPSKPCPFCVGRNGHISSTCEDCMGSGVEQPRC